MASPLRKILPHFSSTIPTNYNQMTSHYPKKTNINAKQNLLKSSQWSYTAKVSNASVFPVGFSLLYQSNLANHLIFRELFMYLLSKMYPLASKVPIIHHTTLIQKGSGGQTFTDEKGKESSSTILQIMKMSTKMIYIYH